MFALILTESAFLDADTSPVVTPSRSDHAKVEALARSIVGDGHYVLRFHVLEKALAAIENGVPDVVVIDFQRVCWASLEQIGVVHLRNPSVPILVIGVRMTDHEVVMALDAGASECVDASCAPSVFLARLRALVRRPLQNTRRPAHIQIGAYELCIATRSVLVAGRPVALTDLEFDVAWTLFSNFERTVPREALLRNVWRLNVDRDTRRIDVLVVRLRNKLKFSVTGELQLTAVRGQGYRILRSAKPLDDDHVWSPVSLRTHQ
ncbi:response regulator transcription factor [Pandoraea apista]|uniref:DNA-binding response regulator n=1 Tax=Pandoraea apista TaxID=93218 RepID=A0A5E5PA67_9BURK|nr:response regulator transcription factor [Pandoraea apista]AVF41350.1 DNA-binding response regulator [Pandoraea apista]OXS93878.1 DNA-binding response regulator [Pandoraea apista]PTE01255.1 DNA-binding response regulator [Pandoraea apista]RRJ34394.1 DNA-binding response regulator [Pandoraea apista]RRJ81461.1 DNA-binding response regulator [Pandoraea apista]